MHFFQPVISAGEKMTFVSEIHIDNTYNWHEHKNEAFVLYGICHDDSLSTIKDKILESNSQSQSEIVEMVSNVKGHFAGVIETENFICAFVDKIRSYPVFYCFVGGGLKVSNSARMLKKEAAINKVNLTSQIEYSMAGYVTGSETMYEDLFQLKAGELLFFNKQENELKLDRYFNYYPVVKSEKSEDYYIEQLGEVIDRVFRRMIDNVAGAPIWVPLSGGLDSRLIISKLANFGYDDLHTFSYGPQRNYEAKEARRVAETIGVPWVFVKTSASRSRELFSEDDRKEYWNYADGLCSMPAMNEYASLHTLRDSGQLPDCAVLINGQSGDFISGGHVSPKLLNGCRTTKELLNAIMNKHYSIWQDLNIEKNILTIENKILSTLNIKRDTEFSMEEIAAYYEQWEWQERQAKMVVNGQRLYDYLGLRWQLPLWDAEFISFWETVPLKLRLQQSLYIKYLERYDYMGLFKDFKSEARRWPGITSVIIPLIQKMGQILGIDTGIVQKYASYWGHYGDQYAFYGLKYFFQNISNATIPPQARGVIALGTKTWLKENGIK